ncbi:MAG TPA: hypothetical protein VKQ36_05750 [Ktedonobacterales bacterium]|nr:hypothetical protein [Ktedonobacterales bacterium]
MNLAPIAVNWLALSAATAWIVSVLKPLIEAIPDLHPHANPADNSLHDGVIRAVSVVISLSLVFAFAAANNQLTAENTLNILLYALATMAGAQTGYQLQTRNGGSIGDSVGQRLGAAPIPMPLPQSNAPTDPATAPDATLDGVVLASQSGDGATHAVSAPQAAGANA